jgi:Stigma-specific protein, Stig1
MHRSLRIIALAGVLALAALAGCSDSGKKCPEGQTDCGGACVDLKTNAVSCGACLNVCPTGAACVDGACQCPAGQVDCDGACADLQTDPLHCGACDLFCGEHGTCTGGACTCDATGTACPGPGNQCPDLQTDRTNCGACRTTCKPSAVCDAGQCACRAPKPDDCTTLCTDVQTDERNCGTCGHDCPLTNDVCVGGACQCPTGLAACPQPNPVSCVDERTDAQNCGACGTQCGTGATCTDGACRCPAGQAACNGACIDTRADAANCGACDHACLGGQTCSSGACVCGTDQRACTNFCCAPSACEFVLPNGLGQDYATCLAPQHAHDQAVAAALAWSPGGQIFDGTTPCGTFCLCTTRSTQAAVWCYEGSPLSGFVKQTDSPNCAAAQCPILGQLPWR